MTVVAIKTVKLKTFSITIPYMMTKKIELEQG